MNSYKNYVSLVLGIVSGFFIIKSFLSRNKSPPKIKKLIIYPIKSLQGIEVDRLEIEERGAKYGMFRDRSLVLLGDKNQLLTLRNRPKMALISLELKDHNQIIANGPGMEPLTIIYDTDCSTNELITFDVWGQTTQGYLCEEYIGEWFSEFLGCKAKMIKYAEGLLECHSVVLDKVLDTTVFFQDFFPILLLGQASIDDLNRRLNGKKTVSHRNFRPNFLVDQCDAFAEDDWKKFRVNGVEYEILKPCDRCTLTTVDLDKGIKSEDGEPLKTMKTYRIDPKWNERAPLFGVNCIPSKSGDISVGDVVEVIEYK